MKNILFALVVLFVLVATGCASKNETASSQKNAYLFTYFTGDSKDGLHLAWSRDGYTWEKLGVGASYLKPSVGEAKLMRDPCVTRGPDGVYHMVWTTAWDGQTIGYASTRDFLTWSQQEAIPVMGGIEGVRNCWAPEIIYDETHKNFLIYWSSTVDGRFTETAGTSENKYNHRLYFTTTTDFKTFTPPQVYDPGFSVIDGTVFKYDAHWYLILKDETVNPPKKHLRVARALDDSSPAGPYDAQPAAPFSRDWVEGPAALIAPGGEALVYFDVYREKHYGALASRDMKTWEDVTNKISLPAGIRHGTIIQVPMAIIGKLLMVERVMSRPPPNVSSMLP